MKTLFLLAFILFSGMLLSAQEQSPIPKISQQLTDYFSYNPQEKVFMMTDKVVYKPGETIWFQAFVSGPNNQLLHEENLELFVKLYDKTGKQVVQDIFKMKSGSCPGDLNIPDDLQKGSYFLVATTSVHNLPEEISCTPITINPQYSNQLVATAIVKDSISVSGQKNELELTLRNVSGEIQKNTTLRYQMKNGDQIIEKGKLKTDDKGKVIIPFTLPAKLNGEPFVCLLTDSKEEWTKQVFLPSDIDPILIRFYPEGGNLINGTPVKVGFTATNKWGVPVDVEGSVVNQEGNPITMVKSFTKGIGLFSMVPDGQQKYKLVLSGKTGKGQSFDLPASLPDGLALAVVKTDADFISANLTFADKKKHAIALTVTQGRILCWAADMNIDGMGRIKIPAETLPQGINLLSVFSDDGILLGERIVFVDKSQQMKIEVQAGKQSLKTSEKMNVKVRISDENGQPLSGSVSIAVSDKFWNDKNKSQIEKNLMIGSELDTPFSLISSAIQGRINNSALLDVFLITNRIKGFDWDKIRNFKSGATAEKNPENNSISGVVTDKAGNKINKAKISVVNNKNMQMTTTTTNGDGSFSFPSLNSANPDDFSVKATDQEGKRELNVTFNKNFESQVSEFIANYARQYSLLNADDIPDKTYVVNNPDLFQKIPKPVRAITNSYENQRKLLSTSTNILDVIKSIKAYRIMSNQIVFLGSENSLLHQGGALLVLDGQQMGTDISSISNISPSEVDHINVSTNPMDIQRYTGLNSVGVIEIFQKKAEFQSKATEKENANKYDGGYRIPNVFPADQVKQKSNTRTTLLWIPEQKVNETGQFEFTITGGKVISDFVIEVQGIAANGRIGSGKAEFQVVK